MIIILLLKSINKSWIIKKIQPLIKITLLEMGNMHIKCKFINTGSAERQIIW